MRRLGFMANNQFANVIFHVCALAPFLLAVQRIITAQTLNPKGTTALGASPDLVSYPLDACYKAPGVLCFSVTGSVQIRIQVSPSRTQQ